jgi:hypothetical protein
MSPARDDEDFAGVRRMMAMFGTTFLFGINDR